MAITMGKDQPSLSPTTVITDMEATVATVTGAGMGGERGPLTLFLNPWPDQCLSRRQMLTMDTTAMVDGVTPTTAMDTTGARVGKMCQRHLNCSMNFQIPIKEPKCYHSMFASFHFCLNDNQI